MKKPSVYAGLWTKKKLLKCAKYRKYTIEETKVKTAQSGANTRKKEVFAVYIPNGGLSGVSDAVSVLVDQYKQEFSITDEDITRNSGMLNNVLLYIYDFEIKPNIDRYRDIESINGLFNIYISLCYFYDIKPNINTFLSWLNISKSIYKSLINGDHKIYISEKGQYIYNIKEFNILYPKDKYYIFADNSNSSIVSAICRRWFEVCEASVIDGILNTRGNPAGLIFVSKSVYGYSENKTANEETEKIGSRTADAIASDYSGIIENCSDQKNNLPALP